uniref:MyoD family inhibitor domain containing n=1 Tax=Oryzias latipes TaxID=8090 RepID=A0A3P9MMG8_ORYLA
MLSVNQFSQPLLATAPPEEATQEAAAFQKPLLDDQQSTCPQCGLLVPEHRLQPAHQLKNSKDEMVSFLNTTAIVRPHMYSFSFVSLISSTDYCFHLLLACLWCEFSVLLLGLMEACSSCLQGLCSSCCHACARCCSAIQDTPVEEFNCHAHCHSVLFESCCEPTECLEFCLECCEICHRS